MSDLTLPGPNDPEDAGEGVIVPDLGAGGLPGGDGDLGGFDMGALLEQAMGMQQQLLEAQAEAAEAVVEGQAGGGVVKVRVTGGMVFESVTIAPEAVDPDDVELLQDLVLAALNDAMDAVGRMQQASMGGFDLGAMGDMLGIGGSPDDDADEDDDDAVGPGADDPR